MEYLHACFRTRDALKFSFDNCRGCEMLVSFCFSGGKVRGPVDVVQAWLSTINVLKPDFHNCGCYAMLVTPVSVLVRSGKTYCVIHVKIVQACFRTRYVL